MIRYISRRFANSLFLLVVVSAIVFGLAQAAPGDFFSDATINQRISAETVAALRARYGMEKSLPVRYWGWLRSLGTGELGYSFAYDLPVGKILWPRMGHTLLLTVPALLLSWLVAVPLGILVATRRGSLVDRIFSVGTSAMLALPDLLIALLILLFALRTRMFPVGGMNSVVIPPGWWSGWKDTAWHMFLPVLAIAFGALPMILRHTRASMMEVLDSPYVRAARGLGLSRFVTLYRHALPAAANPLISLLGVSVGGLLSVSLLVGVLVSWPGIGPLVLEAVLGRDLFLGMGAVMFFSVFLIAGGLLADILLYLLDPRIRMQS